MGMKCSFVRMKYQPSAPLSGSRFQWHRSKGCGTYHQWILQPTSQFDQETILNSGITLITAWPLNVLVKTSHAVQGMESVQSRSVPIGFDCSTCNESKAHRSPTPAANFQRASQPLEMVYMDGFGPISTAAIGNQATYGVIFVDCYSGANFTYLMRSKDQICSVLKRFLSDTAALCQQYPLQCLRRDNAKEYKSAAFLDILTQHKVRSEYLCPYEKHQKMDFLGPCNALCILGPCNALCKWYLQCHCKARVYWPPWNSMPFS